VHDEEGEQVLKEPAAAGEITDFVRRVLRDREKAAAR
jgi:hypothetical protein